MFFSIPPSNWPGWETPSPAHFVEGNWLGVFFSNSVFLVAGIGAGNDDWRIYRPSLKLTNWNSMVGDPAYLSGASKRVRFFFGRKKYHLMFWVPWSCYVLFFECLAILDDPFAMVKWSDPFKWFFVTSNDRGWKGHDLNHLVYVFLLLLPFSSANLLWVVTEVTISTNGELQGLGWDWKGITGITGCF